MPDPSTVPKDSFMPIFDTPITTNDASIDRVLAQKLPILVYLFTSADRILDSGLERLASTHAGDLLVVRVHAGENPQTYARFDRPGLPAAVALQNGSVTAKGTLTGVGDLDAYANFALGRGPQPIDPTHQTAASTRVSPPASGSTSASGTVASAPIHVSDATFSAEVLHSDLPVLVDFWAPWCGPCHMVAPTLDRLAQQYAGRVRIAKVNADENPALISRYQVSGIPQLLMFKQGQVVGKLVGAHPQPSIEQLLLRALS